MKMTIRKENRVQVSADIMNNGKELRKKLVRD
jgi:hypothetical protein